MHHPQFLSTLFIVTITLFHLEIRSLTESGAYGFGRLLGSEPQRRSSFQFPALELPVPTDGLGSFIWVLGDLTESLMLM